MVMENLESTLNIIYSFVNQGSNNYIIELNIITLIIIIIII